MLLLLLAWGGLETSISISSGLGFLLRGSTARRKPFLALGARWADVRGDWVDLAEVGEGAGDGAGDGAEIGAGGPRVFVLRGRTPANTPVLTSCWTVSIAEAFPSRSVTPIWRRWEREWLASPLRFSNSSPHRTQLNSSEALTRLLGGDWRGSGEEDPLDMGGGDRAEGRLVEDLGEV